MYAWFWEGHNKQRIDEPIDSFELFVKFCTNKRFWWTKTSVRRASKTCLASCTESITSAGEIFEKSHWIDLIFSGENILSRPPRTCIGTSICQNGVFSVLSVLRGINFWCTLSKITRSSGRKNTSNGFHVWIAGFFIEILMLLPFCKYEPQITLVRNSS